MKINYNGTMNNNGTITMSKYEFNGNVNNVIKTIVGNPTGTVYVGGTHNTGSVCLGNVIANGGYYVNKVMDELIANGGTYYDCVIGEGTTNGGSYDNCEFVKLVANGGTYDNCVIEHGGKLNGGVFNNCEIYGVLYNADKCVFNNCTMDKCIEQEDYKELNQKLSEFAKGLKQIGTKAKAEPEETEVPKEEPVMAPSNNIVIAKIQELMVKALEEGDFDAYDKLEERLNRISK
jgi:hypothetical protein